MFDHAVLHQIYVEPSALHLTLQTEFVTGTIKIIKQFEKSPFEKLKYFQKINCYFSF